MSLELPALPQGRVLDVVRAPAPVLATPGATVDPADPDVVQLCADLVATMYVSPGCVGLAAQQVGVAAQAFKIEISGVGDMEIAGTCETLDAEVSGVGDLDAGALQCKSVDVTVSGVGDASVYASEAVDATVSGMGDISVSGSPEKVEKNGGMFSNIEVK